MKNIQLINSIESFLNKVLHHLNSDIEEYKLEVWKKEKSKQSTSVLSSKLGLNESMYNEFETALYQFEQYKEDSSKSKIACVRLCLWLETISKATKIEFNIDFENALLNEELAIKQVRAMELLIRDVVSDQIGGNDNIITKLQTLFKQEVIDKWIKSADETGILSGTTFSELSNILLDKNIFQSVEDIFSNSNLELSKTTRDSLRLILEDIRVIRNSIAHNKKISNIQIESLNTFYLEISRLIKESKKTKINPDDYLDLSKSNIDSFLMNLKEDNQLIIGSIEVIKQDLDTIKHDVKSGFNEIKESNDSIKNQLNSKWVSKKFLILYSIIFILFTSLFFAYNTYSNRKINTKIQFSWQSKSASYPFSEIGKIILQTNKISKEIYLNQSGLSEITDISADNLNSKIIVGFNNNKIQQIDFPNLVRDEIINIRLTIKYLEKANFIIRDSKTGFPVKNAIIQFSNLKGNTNDFGKSTINIPLIKTSKFIDLEIIAPGYDYYKMNDVLVNSKSTVEILLDKQ